MPEGRSTVNSSRIEAEIDETLAAFARLKQHVPAIEKAGRLLVGSVRAGGKVMFCGNGGSAADAQHLAAELTGRYRRDRRPLPGLALTTDSSALTAIANDYGYDQVFSRQLRALGRQGDVLVAISTSGNSPSVIEAVRAARELGILVVGLTGESGGTLAPLCDVCIQAPHAATSHVQQMHIAVGHMLCEMLEQSCL